MKVAILSESAADEAAVRILVEAILNQQTERIDLPLRGRGWPSVRDNLPAVCKHLHYRTDAEALVLVVDADDSSVHQTAHEQPDSADESCRLCNLLATVARIRSSLKPIPGRSPLKMAIGLAVPAIEAWYLCGTDSRGAEAAWLQRQAPTLGRDIRNQLKQAVYQTDRPSLALETERAVKEAQRLAQSLALLEQHFPGGFGTLLRAIKSW